MESYIDLTTSLIFICVALLAFIVMNNSHRQSGMPMGPPLLPVIGNLRDISKSENLVYKLREYRKEYGDIFSIRLGLQWVIVINGFDNIKDALVKHSDMFLDRPNIFRITRFLQKRGIVGSSGHIWAKSRTFTINTLKHLGFGKRLLQTRILEEVGVLLEILETKTDENIEIGKFLQGTFANIITSIVCNHRYELSDPKFSKLRENIHKQVQYSQLSGILDLVPFLEILPGDIFKTKMLLDVEDQMSIFFKQHFEEHKETFDESNHRDFIDVYISEMKKNENKDVFTDHQLFRICRDLLLAGTDTTATSIKWCLLHMILKPEIQRKMYQEIKDVIGTERFPSLDDRTKLPYSNAVCNETMRVANVAPLGVPRAPANKQDVEFKGFKIAGDATVYMNYDSIAFDTEIFPDPDEFIPERFLPNSSHYSAKLKYVVPFSMGKRACPGEVLARQEIFLTLVALVQKFKFLPARDRPMPENKRVLGNAFFPKDYELRVQTR